MCFKRFTVFLCIFTLLLIPVNIHADEQVSTTSLYEKYGYQEDFIYKNEFVAHALKASVPKIFLNYSAELRYSPVTFDEYAFENDYMKAYNEFSRTYTDEEIVQAFIEYAREHIDDYLTYSGYKTVETSGTWMGSGVVISEDGYIATNSHVATLNDDSRLQLYLDGLQDEVYYDVEELAYSMQEHGIKLSAEQSDSLYYIILEDSASRSTVISEDIKLEVCFPSSDGRTDLDSATIYEAEIVAEGTQEGIEGLTQDTAILKINADNLVALKLSPTLPETNSTIVSAGYPSASDEAFQMSGSDASILSITVGTGQVSRIVPIDNTSYKAIEINTTISGGNSGGPSVDESLNIEGLNTYVHSGDARYAYMVSAEYVNTLAGGFELKQGETTKTFLTGVQMLQMDYGDSAEECFLYVKQLQPDTPYIDNLIESAKNASNKSYISNNTDNETNGETTGEKKGGIDKSVIFMICIAAGVLILTVGIIAVIIKLLKNYKNVEEDNVLMNNPSGDVQTDNAIPFNAQTDNVPNTDDLHFNPESYPGYMEYPSSPSVEETYTRVVPPIVPEEIKPELRSTMRVGPKKITPSPTYIPTQKPENEHRELVYNPGQPSEGAETSRLIKSHNIKKDE